MTQLTNWGFRLLSAVIVLIAVLAWPARADAYAWMIRHEYSGCNQCHADPSGGGLLTPYGRAQGELLLRSQYGAPAEEAGKVANFLFGAFDLPDGLLLGGDIRYFYFDVIPDQGPAISDNFFMQSDVEGQFTSGSLRINASIGYAQKGALPAAVTHGQSDNLVSRVHWIGYDFGADKQWLLRVGRMNLPFGVRSIEHTMFVRSQTRTDINAAQQHGVSLVYNGDKWRGELMAIAGNFQINPDVFRERGYSGYLEWSPGMKVAIGLSSLVAHADRDVQRQAPLIRHCHGLFGRWAPIRQLVLLAESDVLLDSQPPDPARGRNNPINALGTANMVQADWEVTQGVHLMATAELLDLPPPPRQSQWLFYSAWATAAWLFAPHADVRLDAVWMSQPAGPARSASTTIVAQLHLFL